MLEFKRSTDRDEGFLEVKEAEANEQHKSIIGALKAAAPKWEFEQINFVVGNRGSVVESDFYTKLKSLMYKKEKKTSSLLFMWRRYAKRTTRWLCPSFSRETKIQRRDPGSSDRSLIFFCKQRQRVHVSYDLSKVAALRWLQSWKHTFCCCGRCLLRYSSAYNWEHSIFGFSTGRLVTQNIDTSRFFQDFHFRSLNQSGLSFVFLSRKADFKHTPTLFKHVPNLSCTQMLS